MRNRHASRSVKCGCACYIAHTELPHQRVFSQIACAAACRVLELERMRIADLRDNTEIHERLEAETEVSWGLREALAERRLDAQQ